jgi:hypothetical protein
MSRVNGGHDDWTEAMLDARLAGVGMTRSDWDCLLRNFVGQRFSYVLRRPTRSGSGTWVMRKDRYLSDPLLLDHLDGKLWVGTGCRRYPQGRHATAYLVIDIDLKQSSEQEQREATGWSGTRLARRASSSRAARPVAFTCTSTSLHR